MRLYSEGVVLWVREDIWPVSYPVHRLPSGKDIPVRPEGGPASATLKAGAPSRAPGASMVYLPGDHVHRLRGYRSRMLKILSARGGVHAPMYGDSARYCTTTLWGGALQAELGALTDDFRKWRDTTVVPQWESVLVPGALKAMERFGATLWKKYDSKGSVSMSRYAKDFVDRHRDRIATLETVKASDVAVVAAHVMPVDPDTASAMPPMAYAVADYAWTDLRDAATAIHNLCTTRGGEEHGGPVMFGQAAAARYSHALARLKAWDPCPTLSQEALYDRADEVTAYLGAMRTRLLALEPQALDTVAAVTSRVLTPLYSRELRERRAAYLLGRDS